MFIKIISMNILLYRDKLPPKVKEAHFSSKDMTPFRAQLAGKQMVDQKSDIYFPRATIEKKKRHNMYRNTWMEVDLDAIFENVKTIRKICGKKVIAVLKADAYGCGDIEVARTILKAGAEMVAVSSLDEALMLRNGGCQAEILILGPVNPDHVEMLRRYHLAVSAYSQEWVEKIIQKGVAGIKIHMALDTAMNRIGFKETKTMLQAFADLQKAGALTEGVFTHFCCADSDRAMTDRQYARFAKMVQELHYPFRWIHCDNSDAALFFQDTLSDSCRIGIALYGISTFTDRLLPALGFYSTISMVKQIEAGETVGYGATYTAKKQEWIATVSVGYADGFVRANQGRFVYVAGMRCEVVGRICMDQMMIRLPSPLPIGTVVELFGPHIPLSEMAKELKTIPYEIISLISGRVTRRYKENGSLKMEKNERLIQSGR